MTDTLSREEALVHFGVKGMKWGVRKAEPGSFGRAMQKQATAMTEDRIRQHQKALSGTGAIGLVAKVDKYTWGGGGRFEGYHNKSISQLERSKERIAQGEPVASTILWGPRYSKK